MSEALIYGKEPLGPRVKAVEPMDDYELFLIFDNEEQRVFDAKPLLAFNAFKALCNKGLFNAVYLAHGSIAWPGDIDYCADTLYAESMTMEEWDSDWVRLTPPEARGLEEAQKEYERGECVTLQDIDFENLDESNLGE